MEEFIKCLYLDNTSSILVLAKRLFWRWSPEFIWVIFVRKLFCRQSQKKACLAEFRNTNRFSSFLRYGFATWEFKNGIRSYFYPALIAGLYKILAFLQMDTPFLLALVPRIFQAIISAYSDYRFYIWTNKSKWGLFIMLTSWFWFYTGSRTLINTLECALTTIALSYYPWHKGHGENFPFLFIRFMNSLPSLRTVPTILFFTFGGVKNIYYDDSIFGIDKTMRGNLNGLFWMVNKWKHVTCYMGMFIKLVLSLSLSRKYFLFVDRLAALLHSSNGFIVMVAIVHLSHQKIKLFNDWAFV